MDSISFQVNGMMAQSSGTSPVQNTGSTVGELRHGVTDFVAVRDPAAVRDSTRQLLGSMRALSPTSDPATGQPLKTYRLDENRVPGLTDLSNLPPDLRQALMTFRHVAMEALVPNVAVTVVSSTTSSIKRVQQGQ